MTSQDVALAAIRASGLLAALEWAAPIAFARTGNDYDEDAGHDQSIIGLHNFVYLRDLLDRSTASGRYALPLNAVGEGRDLLGIGIPPEALASMPTLKPGSVQRRDYEHSPGWAADGHRVLLQSFKSGGVDRIKWGQRSKAKSAVALQKYIGALPLFNDEDYGLESLLGIPDDVDFEGVTLVAAHSYDPVTGKFELYIGQSKLPEYRGDSCWHWRVRLLVGDSGPSVMATDTSPTLPGEPASGVAAEINVRYKGEIPGGATGTANE